jgi:hypothetical protein
MMMVKSDSPVIEKKCKKKEAKTEPLPYGKHFMMTFAQW